MNKYITVFDALKLIADASEIPLDELSSQLLETESEQSEPVKMANKLKLWEPHVFIELFQRIAKLSVAGTQLVAAIHNSSGTALALRWYEMTSMRYPKWDEGAANGTMAVLTDISRGYHRAHEDYQSGQLTRNNLKFYWADEVRLKVVCFEREALLALLDNEEIEYSKPEGMDSHAASNQKLSGYAFSDGDQKKSIGIDEIFSVTPTALDSSAHAESRSAFVNKVSDDIPNHSGVTFDEFWDREYEFIAMTRERWSTADLNQLVWTRITQIASTEEAASRPKFFPTAYSGGEELHYTGSIKKKSLKFSASGKRVRARLQASNKLIVK